MSPSIRFDKNTALFLSASSAPGNRGTAFYNLFFQKRGINAVYLSRKCEDARALIDAIRALDVRGCSVSMPLKAQVVPFLDDLDSLARRLGAVNTIVQAQGKLTGFNTDYEGFIRPVLKRGMSPRRVLVCGSGAVASTIVQCLKDHFSEAEISVTGRTETNVAALANDASVKSVLWNEKPHDSWDLLVNATPSGESPSRELSAFATRSSVVYDLLVKDAPTRILDDAKRCGAAVISGAEMFCYQFLAQFRYYTGQEISESEYHEAARELGF